METNEEYNLENFMLITLLPVTIAAIAGLIYTWVLTCEQVRAVKALAWPQTIALLSVLAVTMQALLFFAMISFAMGAINRPMIDWTAKLEVLFFLVALPCALIRKGPARWILALAAIYFLAVAGFVYLVSGIQF